MGRYLAWCADFVGNDFLICNVGQEITFGGKTYQAGKGLRLEGLRYQLGETSGQAQLSFSGADMPTLLKFIEDVGPDVVEIDTVWSEDGDTWQSANFAFAGLMSDTRYSRGVYTIPLVTFLGGADRIEPVKWTYEAQMARTAGADMIFNQVKELQRPRKTRFPS